MQGLVNFATAIADGISVLLPAFCYLMACTCFLFAGWTFRGWSYTGHSHHHHYHQRPWIPFVSLLLCGTFATFPHFLNMANVSAGTNLTTSLTSYAATPPGSASGILGATPSNTVVNVVALFQYFFQAFGAACVFWSLVTFRSIVNGYSRGTASACGIQFVFGVLCINILTVANGVVALFKTGG